MAFRKEETEQSIPARFEQQVRRSPHGMAVKTRAAALTYAALNEGANRLAAALLAQRGEREEPIALLIEHGAPVISALFGTLKAGKIYVPLEPSYPRERLAAMLRDSEAGLVVTNTRNAALARDLTAGSIPLLNVNELPACLPTADPALCLPPDRLACILYTSGSTGQPKGVVHSHRGLLFETLRLTNSFRITPDDRLELFHSCSFSASFRRLFPALLNGAALYPIDVRAEAARELAAWVREEGITLCSGRLLLHVCRSALTGPAQFPRLRLITFGGDTIYRSDVELYRQFLPEECLMVNGLATTETGTDRQYFLTKKSPAPEGVVPVGYPVEGTEILLLDECGAAVEAGAIGEIAVKSRSLAVGYWRKPELTQARFTACPAGGEVRIFHTGDLGRMLPDGCLLHLGRKDSQVKIRGFRVELGEIEAALRQHPAVKECAVLARKEEAEEARLIAYVALNQPASPSMREWRRFLEAKLPEHMLPATYVRMDALPRTPTGKIDRQGLPAPAQEEDSRESAFVAPRDPVELQIAALWENALGVTPIGVREHFLDLGGHSLLATRLLAQVGQAFGRSLPLAALYQAPTIEEMAALLRDGRDAVAWTSLVPIQPAGTRPPLFCVHGVGGHVGGYRSLARQLGPDQPVYGLQAQGMDGKAPLHTRVEEMAAHYVLEIRSWRPVGPYLLAGASFGGIVAFEMARLLQAQGQEVALLALMDSRGPRAPDDTPLRGLARRLRGHWRVVRQLEAGTKLPYALARLQGAKKRLRWWLWKATRPAAPGDTQRMPRGAEELLRIHRRAREEFEPQAYAGRVTLFRAQERSVSAEERSDRGWGRVAGDGVEIHDVPGNHVSMLQKPNLEVMAEELSGCLARAQAKFGGAGNE